METFIKSKAFVDDSHYYEKKEESLRELQISTIDAPIVKIVKGFAELPHYFTLQSCYGHFIHNGQQNPKNLEPLSNFDKSLTIEYRIAYIAICIQNNNLGKQLLQDLKKITKINPEYIQFGCAEWFWRRQVNSYALQVTPEIHLTAAKPLPIQSFYSTILVLEGS
ncbi:MAG: hypothetical protein KAR64_08585 [Thermoplasmatales archaeon]|nr:hypothetical protein [Thermoplasmatales archaeon]